MAEDESPTMEPKYGLTNDDITPKIYEGGFKTWECSIDLAYHVAKQLKPLAGGQGLPDGRFHMIEVGRHWTKAVLGFTFYHTDASLLSLVQDPRYLLS